jgi:sirohydrochlorin cobaltochelatase
MTKNAVILIGHGGVPRDFPREKIGRPEFEDEIRNWPRTPENDPFCFGMKAIAAKLEPKFPDAKLVLAYNEFCAPSIEQAVEDLAAENFENITFLTTMFTPGGIHSEVEIPEAIEALRIKYPNVRFNYPWPFNLDKIAQFLSEHTINLS